MKATHFEDVNIIFAILPQGKYFIDNEVVTTTYQNNKVQIKDINNVYKIEESRVINHYINGDKILLNEEYVDIKLRLENKRIKDEYEWETLNDEFAYRKFIELWKPVYETISIKNRIDVEVEKTVLNSKIPFIVNYFTNDKSETTLYQYNRIFALSTIIRNKFTELGIMYKDDAKYDDTKNEKIWSNSTHSGIEYLRAFNKYICPEEYKRIIPNYNNTLKNCEELYYKDKDFWEDYIQTQYNVAYGKIQLNEDIMRNVLISLKGSLRNLKDVKTKGNSHNDLAFAVKSLKEGINTIEKLFKVNDEL